MITHVQVKLIKSKVVGQNLHKFKGGNELSSENNERITQALLPQIQACTVL